MAATAARFARGGKWYSRQNESRLEGMTPGGDEYVQLLDASGSQSKRPLFGLSNEQLTEAMHSLGQPAYRGKQLSEALYRQWNTTFDDISTLPKDLRKALS